jgi:hypothetical protein
MPTGVTSSDQVFTLNSLWDPDFTGGGHLPRYFNQLLSVSGPYSLYNVIWADVDVTVGMTSESTGTQVPISVSLVPTATSSALTASVFPEELPGAVPPVVTGGYQPPAVLKRRFYPHEIFGVSPEHYTSDDTFNGSYNSNPGSQLFVHLFATSLDNATNVLAWYRMKITYKCSLFARPNETHG